MQGGSHLHRYVNMMEAKSDGDLWRASLMFLCLPSLETRLWSLEIVPDDWNIHIELDWLFTEECTVLLILFHVSFSRNTEELVKAAHTWRTPLKLWRHRQMSATAAHFSEGQNSQVWGVIIIYQDRDCD